MGPRISVQNQRYSVQIDLQTEIQKGKVLVLKVCDRRDMQGRFLHIKKYQYYQIPIQLRQKCQKTSTLARNPSNNEKIECVFAYLIKNESQINITDKSLTIKIDQHVVQVPFQNKGQESIIACEQRNQRNDILKSGLLRNTNINFNLIIQDQQKKPNQYDFHKKKHPNQRPSRNQNQNQNDNSNQNDNQNEKQIQSINQLINKIRNYNNRQSKDFSQLNLSEIVQTLNQQFKQWQNNDFKHGQSPKTQKDQQIQLLKHQIIRLDVQKNMYKEQFLKELKKIQQSGKTQAILIRKTENDIINKMNQGIRILTQKFNFQISESLSDNNIVRIIQNLIKQNINLKEQIEETRKQNQDQQNHKGYVSKISQVGKKMSQIFQQSDNKEISNVHITIIKNTRLQQSGLNKPVIKSGISQSAIKSVKSSIQETRIKQSTQESASSQSI